MDHTDKAFGGFGENLFAGTPVKDIKKSIAWYEKLLGCAPNFFPNEKEAVWALGDNQWLYLIVNPERAGGAIHTILGKDLEKLIDEIAQRGIDFDEEEAPAEGVRKVMYHDPDGNEIGLGRATSA